MKNYAVKSALCMLLVIGTSIAEIDQVDQEVKTHRVFPQKDDLKKLYVGILKKARVALKNDEVVAARKTMYAAIKNVLHVMKEKMHLNPEELAQLEREAAALNNWLSDKADDNFMATCLIDVHSAIFIEAIDEFNPTDKSIKAEVAVFKQS